MLQFQSLLYDTRREGLPCLTGYLHMSHFTYTNWLSINMPGCLPDECCAPFFCVLSLAIPIRLLVGHVLRTLFWLADVSHFGRLKFPTLKERTTDEKSRVREAVCRRPFSTLVLPLNIISPTNVLGFSSKKFSVFTPGN